jgi:hypothetical protein
MKITIGVGRERGETVQTRRKTRRNQRVEPTGTRVFPATKMLTLRMISNDYNLCYHSTILNPILLNNDHYLCYNTTMLNPILI